MSRRLPLTTCLGATIVASLLATAASGAASRRLDPLVTRAIDTGVVSPFSARLLGRTPGEAPVMLMLSAAPTPAVLARLEAAGAKLRRIDGRPLLYDRFVPARVTAAAVAALLSRPEVSRIALAPPLSPPPLDHSAELVGLEAAWGARPALDRVTGKGTVLADLDSNADVFHPQFFRADAGYFDWIDVDADGIFDHGVDAIDLDRDGAASAGETAVLLRAETLWTYYAKPADARKHGFDPAIDWLYLDTNGNGSRDYGEAGGFDDTAPALGEPLFVPDDLDRDGVLEPGERVVRLGTPKFKKVYVHIEYYGNVDHVFERGVDLAKHKNEYTNGAYGYSDASHGSGVLSIAAGDVPLAGRRWVGMAPDADLLLGFEVAQSEAGSVTWALGQKPDVALHETAPWTGAALDGSDSYSAAVDTSAVKDSVTHACPVGNTGGARKHTHLSLGAAASKTITFDSPVFKPPEGPARYVDVTLNVRGAPDVKVTLKEPGGAAIDVTGGPGWGTLSTGADFYLTRETSARGTYLVDVLLYTQSTSPTTKQIPTGTWTLELQGHAQKAAEIDGYLMDDVSSWGLGVAWPAAIATDDRTIGYPAVADHCIAVGAHTGHPQSSSEPWFAAGAEAQGQVRGYSGRGPRIDGVQKPDVVAPDNPWAAAPHTPSGTYKTPYGAVWPFGGTSGAGPHVAGVGALLAQAGIRGDAARQAIRDGAIHDATTGTTPNADYGWGRLSAAGAFKVKASGKAPTLALAADPTGAAPGGKVALVPTASDPDGPASALEIEWDDGYDGTWDVAYGPMAPRQVVKTVKGKQPVKARVRDGEGRIAEAVVWIGPELPVVDAGAEAGSETGSEASSQGDGEADAAVEPLAPEPPALDTAPAAAHEGGCGCRAAGQERRGWEAFGCIAVAAVAARRPRRK